MNAYFQPKVHEYMKLLFYKRQLFLDKKKKRG